MTASRELRCHCIRCGGLLEFPRRRSGEVMQCYHCGLETWLHAEAADPDEGWKDTAELATPRRIPIHYQTSTPSKVPFKLPSKTLKNALMGLVGLVVAAHLVCLGLALSTRRAVGPRPTLHFTPKASVD